MVTLTPAAAQQQPEEEPDEPAEQPVDRWCAPEPAGDTFHQRDDARVDADDPPADLRGFCAAHHEDVVALELTLAEPVDLAQWGGESLMAWFVDTTGDGEHELLAEIVVEDGEPVVSVIDRRGEEDEVTCTGTATVDGAQIALAGVDPACFGGAGWLRVTAMTVRDTDPADDDEASLAYDLADERVAVAPPSQPPRRDVDRIAGTSRVATSARIARRAFPDGADRVYLARADDFADALAASSVAGEQGRDTDGPVLLVPSCGELPDAAGDALADLAPRQVIALGGEAAICDGIVEQASAAGNAGRRRIAGRDRWSTAADIALEAYPDGADAVYVATGEGFADALAAGALRDGPVLLTPSCGAPPSPVAQALDRLDPDRVVGVGGTAALCDETLFALAEGREVSRLRDERYRDRFGTARTVAQSAFPDGSDVAYLARGDAFADALSAASLTDGPVLLTPSCGSLPPASARGVRHLDPDRVVAIGGAAAVCDQVRRNAANS